MLSFMDVCCLPVGPNLIPIANHPSTHQPSMELAVVQRVTHSPPHILSPGNIVELALVYIPVVKIRKGTFLGL